MLLEVLLVVQYCVDVMFCCMVSWLMSVGDMLGCTLLDVLLLQVCFCVVFCCIVVLLLMFI